MSRCHPTTEVTFALPLDATRITFAPEALATLAETLPGKTVQMPDGEAVGTVMSAAVRDGSVVCVAVVEEEVDMHTAGYGVAVWSRKIKREGSVTHVLDIGPEAHVDALPPNLMPPGVRGTDDVRGR